MLRVLICDDEPLALDRLTGLLAQCVDVELVGQALSGQALLAEVGTLTPDLILLDIEMPKVDGFDVVEALSRMVWTAPAAEAPLIVFVTAHPETAARAYETGALDFISKPVRLSRLEQVLSRARAAKAQSEAGRRLTELSAQLDELKRIRGGGETPHLWVRRGPESVRLDVELVDWIAAEGEYIRFHVGLDSYLERGSLTEMATLLGSLGFVRVHRSAIVNAERVISVERKRWGDLILGLTNGATVPVGKTYRDVARRLTTGGLTPA